MPALTRHPQIVTHTYYLYLWQNMQQLICLCNEYLVYSLHNKQQMKRYIHQLDRWPELYWSNDDCIGMLGEVRHLQGRLLGRMESIGFEVRNQAVLDTLTIDIIKTSEIEGEILHPDQVRSSVARKLGLEIAGSVESDRNVDGVVEMMVDAMQNCLDPLTVERLFSWHAALFPPEGSGMPEIRAGDWREDTTGPMQVVSGAMGKERVHFQAPHSSLVPFEMKNFLDWYNTSNLTDLVLKAAVAHLWFVTVHPFEDGNGRIARAVTDMLLARSDGSTQRFYSMSAQIRRERKKYYEILEKTQTGDLDITGWVLWFLGCLLRSIKSTDIVLDRVLKKASFWNQHSSSAINERQKKLLNRLLDGFEGNLTSSKWAKIARCSRDTAIRDINDLIRKDILKRAEGGGRSTSYLLR